MNRVNGVLATALVAGVTLTASGAHAQVGEPSTETRRRVTVEIRGHFLMPSDDAFDQIYGGAAAYGLEVAYRVASRLDVWAGGSRIAEKGLLTFSREETEVSVVPLSVGVRYHLRERTVSPHAALGAGYFLFEESNVLGDVSDSGLGLLVNAGAFVRLHRRVFLDLRVGYSYCKLKPAELEINVGGVELGGGLALRF